MDNTALTPNPDWQQLDIPKEGDLVHLKYIRELPYLLKIIVSSVDGDKVTGAVQAIYNWGSQDQITAKDPILALLGKIYIFNMNFMQKVFKKHEQFK